MDPDPSQAGGYVVATRSGVHDWQPEQRTIIVEFTGTPLAQAGEVPITADVKAIGENAEKAKFLGIAVQSTARRTAGACPSRSPPPRKTASSPTSARSSSAAA